MNTAQLKDYCRQLPGVSIREYGHPANILVYFIGDKRFAYFKTSEPEQWRFSIRVSPERFLELTDVPGIKPARYFARFHWVSIVNPQSLSEEYLLELIGWSYRKAFGSLSRVQQKIYPLGDWSLAAVRPSIISNTVRENCHRKMIFLYRKTLYPSSVLRI